MTITATDPDQGAAHDGLLLVADPWADGWTLPSTEELKAVGWPGARPEGEIPLRKVELTPAQQYAMRMSGPVGNTAVLDKPPLEVVTDQKVSMPAVEQMTDSALVPAETLLPEPGDATNESDDDAVVDLTKTVKRKRARARRPRRRAGRLHDLVQRHRRLRLTVATVATAYWYFALATLALAVVVPVVAGWRTTTVMSNSMEPSISQGDVLALAEYDGTLLGEGTIIQFEDPVRDGETLTHRIVAVNADGTYQTQGDANRGPDSTRVAADAIVGVARMVSPFAGLPHFWLATGQYLWLGAWILLTAGAATVMTPRRVASKETAPAEPETKIRSPRLAPATDGPSYSDRS